MDVPQIINKNKESIIAPDGIAIFSRERKIIIFNEAATRITGFTEDDIIDQNIELLFGETTNIDNILNDVFEKKLSYTNLKISINDIRKKEKNVLASVIPIVRENVVISVVFVFRDTNEMLSLVEKIQEKTSELVEQKNKLSAIFNSSIEGTFTIDQNWNITSFNASAEKITGYSKNEALNKKCWEIFNSNLCRNGCHMEQTLAKGKRMIGNEIEIIHKTGKKIPIRVNSAVLLNEKNQKIGAVETFLDISELKNLSSHLETIYNYDNIIGSNNEIQKIKKIIESVAKTDTTVLITGESGTGKELIARAIHLNSNRKNKPFVVVNCSAYVESLIESELFGHEKGAFTGAIKTKPGKFELAEDGTIFLDEFGDLSLQVQTKLLRVLENQEFERVGGNQTLKLNARIIAATNKNLLKLIDEKLFREDLYYRINVINIHLPPLRERLDDLPLLINHFIEKYNKKFKKNIKNFSTTAYKILLEYDWPGNIRELENVVEHSFVLCNSDIIQPENLPTRLQNLSFNSNKSEELFSNDIKSLEKQLILSLLEKHKYNKKLVAEELKVHPSTLWRKIKKFNIM